MFEKLFRIFKKEDKPVINVPEEKTQQERELEEERQNAENINKQVDEIDSGVAQDIEDRIREEFKSEFEVDPSNLEECFEELESIKDDLLLEFVYEKKDPVLETLERKIINKVFEEELIALGSSLDEYYKWQAEEELEDNLSEGLEEEEMHIKR